jgi:hypothetical protein
VTTYHHLTKKVLQDEYDQLGSISAIAKKYNIPNGSVKRLIHKFRVEVDSPGGKCKYTVNENIFSDDSEKSFYIAGFIAADGGIRGNCGLIFGLAQKDKDHLVKIRELMDFTGPIRDYSYIRSDSKLNDDKQNNTSRMCIYCSEKLVSDLYSNFNVTPQKTFTYKFPNKIINHDFVKHFIRGYFDGDGCFYFSKRDQSVSFELLGTRSFLESVKYILERECQFASKIIVRPIKNIFRLRYRSKIIVFKIVNWLYGDSTIFLKRKRDKIKHLIKT